MKSMMNIYVLVFFVMTRISFNIIDMDNIHVSGVDTDIINQALSKDKYFKDMKYVKVLGAGSYGLVVLMKKEVGDGMGGTTDKFIAVKIGSGGYLQDYSEVIGDDLMEINTDNLSVAVKGIRVTDYLRAESIPFVTYVHTFRHIVFARKTPDDSGKRVEPVGSLVVQAMDYADEGDLYKYSVWLRKSSGYNATAKRKAFHELWYRILLIYKMVKDKGILHGDIKEDNIFLVKRKDKNDELWPVIGDWDFSFKYTEESAIPNGVRFTSFYRPPEMQFMTDNHFKINQGLFGYRYSGKEDIFAIAVMLVSIGRKARISFTKNEQDILCSMAYPLTWKELNKRAYAKHKVKNAFKQSKKIDRYFTDSFVINRNIINALAKDILDKLALVSEGVHSDVHSYLDEYTDKDSKLNGMFAFPLIQFLHDEQIDKSKLHKLLKPFYEDSTLEKDKIDQFFYMIDKIKDVNPFEKMLKKRPEPMDVLKLLRKEMFPALDSTKQTTALLNDLDELDSYGLSLLLEHDTNKSEVWVHPTFYNLTPNQIEPYLNIFDLMTRNNNHRYGRSITMPDDELQIYSVYNFSGQLLNLFKLKKKESEDNMDIILKTLLAGRKKKRDLSQVDTQVNTNKQVKQRKVI